MVFTKPSIKIQEFLKNIPLSPAFHFSPSAVPVIEKIYNQATAGHLSKPNATIVQKTVVNPGAPWTKGSSYEYMEDSIKSYIKELKKYITEVQLFVGERKYTIFFINTRLEPVDNYVKWINTWLQVATLYARPDCSKTVLVYLYLTDLKKMLPNKNKIKLNAENANTAFTTSCQLETEIILYRREEWFKVFIHESFHNLGLDFIGQPINKNLLQIFPIHSNFKLYETYTEMWAELMNIIFINVATGKSFNKYQLEKHIQIERKFSLMQSAKILNHFGITYSDILTGKAKEIYKEDTEVFCYFILKTILLYNCNDFIEWLDNHQKPVSNKVEKFIQDLIIPRYNEIQKVMDKFQQYAQPNKTFIGSTLRMTALEQLL
jgi:uncharacterized ubiquitin-like protein YukD